VKRVLQAAGRPFGIDKKVTFKTFAKAWSHDKTEKYRSRTLAYYWNDDGKFYQVYVTSNANAFQLQTEVDDEYAALKDSGEPAVVELGDGSDSDVEVEEGKAAEEEEESSTLAPAGDKEMIMNTLTFFKETTRGEWQQGPTYSNGNEISVAGDLLARYPKATRYALASFVFTPAEVSGPEERAVVDATRRYPGDIPERTEFWVTLMKRTPKKGLQVFYRYAKLSPFENGRGQQIASELNEHNEIYEELMKEKYALMVFDEEGEEGEESEAEDSGVGSLVKSKRSVREWDNLIFGVSPIVKAYKNDRDKLASSSGEKIGVKRYENILKRNNKGKGKKAEPIVKLSASGKRFIPL